MARRLWPLLLVVACGGDVPHASLDARRTERTSRAATSTPDTAAFVARQSGEPVASVSAVMQLRVAAQDAEVAVENEAGQQAMTGAIGGDTHEEIVGSRAVSSAVNAEAPAAGWRALVTVPVLEGERYLLELAPSTPRRDSATVEVAADGVRLGGTRVAVDATSGEAALFEVAIGSRSVTVSPQIARIDIVPSCGTNHVVRSNGRADLYAQYEVIETREHGDIRIPPRADDAQFRSVSFRTRTAGGVRITYLGRELATAPRPEACPAL